MRAWRYTSALARREPSPWMAAIFSRIRRRYPDTLNRPSTK